MMEEAGPVRLWRRRLSKKNFRRSMSILLKELVISHLRICDSAIGSSTISKRSMRHSKSMTCHIVPANFPKNTSFLTFSLYVCNSAFWVDEIFEFCAQSFRLLLLICRSHGYLGMRKLIFQFWRLRHCSSGKQGRRLETKLVLSFICFILSIFICILGWKIVRIFSLITVAILLLCSCTALKIEVIGV